MPLQATSGAASYDAFGGGVPVVPAYIEEVFSTYLYTGNNSTQTITNGIDLLGKGGMVWTKSRTEGTWPHIIAGTNFSSVSNSLSTNNTSGIVANSDVTAWNSNGYTMDVNSGYMNYSGNFVSWTFRKQPKFFDIQTYTGTGVAGKIVTHNLGSVPGCIMVKKTSGAEEWCVYHVGAGSVWTLVLNSTAAKDLNNNFNYTNGLTSTEFQVGSNTPTNENGATYVAYLFAHNAGGFGLTGTDNVISCGSFTTNGSGNASITLGYEPQWVLVKSATQTSQWTLLDTMRGWTTDGSVALLFANLANAESNNTRGGPTATGFNWANGNPSETNIYIAIRRGPMKVPTSGTSVFVPAAQTDTTPVTTNFPVDFFLENVRAGSVYNTFAASRLTGNTPNLRTSSTNAEETGNMGADTFTSNTKLTLGIFGVSAAIYAFQRAPSFFDEVCYTGTGSTLSVSHNLTVTPQLAIIKRRNASSSIGWVVVQNPGAGTDLILNSTASTSNGYSFLASWSASSFTVGANANVGGSGDTYVAYLFATCAGVSKVGSYTGNGTTQTIDCGFTGGARFVLIKRTDASGDWYTYDTARGMTVLTDPYLLLNTTAAETATLGSVTTVSTGFALNSTILAAINISGGTYIFLAIA
ncbi:hypothetical protein UFOVP307_18 [uncultured Caudovirales phage]|uniref:DUF7483 domain-containing protein n=1 Tax=uncultured Caudovirales phage TaxID=2100421 RepID=A0A6J5LUL2_9CAUD|nr:hypothetical protein UFOVP307_18 [uncultured Caudovirales phage]